MATLEEKILNGPNVGYCSSSEDEDDDAPVITTEDIEPTVNVRKGIRNTGPKGVIEDWRVFQEEQELLRIQNEKKIIAASKYATLTFDLCAKVFTKTKIPFYFKVIELTTKEQFLTAIEKSQNTFLLIHIYEDNVVGCQTLNEVLCSVAVQFPRVRLARIKSSVLETSARFTSFGLPTLQVYYSDTLVGNFVRICDQLGEDFKPVDLLKFLYEKEIYLEYDDDSDDKDFQ
uniref:Phosducin domain-containing protein n=1 Tax=Syphacia muris TaxID=451379 RepID=A0A0N5AQU4_9BILA